MKRLTLTILLAAQCICGQFAHADSSSEPPLQVVVHFADLDLGRTHGAAALYTRLLAAAHVVCAPLEGRDLGRMHRFGACIADALSTAVAKVDRPLLSAYYRAKLGGRRPLQPEVATR